MCGKSKIKGFAKIPSTEKIHMFRAGTTKVLNQHPV